MMVRIFHKSCNISKKTYGLELDQSHLFSNEMNLVHDNTDMNFESPNQLNILNITFNSYMYACMHVGIET